jgi:hypothetical protein
MDTMIGLVNGYGCNVPLHRRTVPDLAFYLMLLDHLTRCKINNVNRGLVELKQSHLALQVHVCYLMMTTMMMMPAHQQ